MRRFERPKKDQRFSDWPTVGETLVDADPALGRTLRVTAVYPKDPQFRNVRGVLTADGAEYPYSCDAEVLLAVWARQ